MPKLTETTNDQLGVNVKTGQRGRPRKQQNGNGAIPHPIPMTPHIVAAHEPLKNETIPFQTPHQFGFGNLQTPPVAPAVQLPLKVALIGTAPSSRTLAPYNDPTWQIWACSPGNMNALPRFDAWFEIHGTLHWPENQNYGPAYIQFLSQLKCPVYMQDQRYCPNAITFPMQDMVKEFGPYHFTSSFSWMMAFAISKGAKEIAFYGIDMASRDEYILQRQGIYPFFVEARKRGIKVFAPYESDIMQPAALYGYSEVTPFGRKLIARKQELNGRLTEMRQQRDALIRNITYLEGAVEDMDYIETIWGGVQNNSGLDIELKELEKAKGSNA